MHGGSLFYGNGEHLHTIRINTLTTTVRIRHPDTAPGDIRHGRGGIAASIGVNQLHAHGRAAAGGGGFNTGSILLRNRKATDRHRFGGDVGCGAATVPDTFRIYITCCSSIFSLKVKASIQFVKTEPLPSHRGTKRRLYSA